MTLDSSDRLRTARTFVAVAYSVAIMAIAMQEEEAKVARFWLEFTPILLWTISPIVVPLLVWRSDWALIIGVTGIATYSLMIYLPYILGESAASASALIYLLFPLWQWVGVALLMIVLPILRPIRSALAAMLRSVLSRYTPR